MARNAAVTLTTGTWTQITDADVAGDISISLISGGPILLQATATASAPSGTDGFPLVYLGDGWSEATIAEKFTGVSGADRLWGRPDRSDSANAVVFVSYA